MIVPILAPGLVAVALFGFTLSYDEFTRTLLTAGPLNTLPLEIWSMTLNVTSPSLYALGTVTTLISFVIIGVASAPSRSSRSGGRPGRRHIRKLNNGGSRGDIELAGIVKSYDGVTRVVDGINLKIPDRAYCCFLGRPAAARRRSCA